jgi:hypothetical protein
MYNLPIISNELTKNQIKIVAESCVQQLIDNGAVIESADAVAKMELLIKEIRANKDYVEAVRDEVTKFGKSVTTPSGTKIELAEVGTKYDFSVCNDSVLNQLETSITELELMLKERKEFLKTVSIGGLDMVTPEGELIRVYPPSKTSTSSFKSTIQK